MRISVSVACSAALVVFLADAAAAQGKGGPKVTTPGAAHGSPAATAPKSAPTKTTTSAPKANPPGHEDGRHRKRAREADHDDGKHEVVAEGKPQVDHDHPDNLTEHADRRSTDAGPAEAAAEHQPGLQAAVPAAAGNGPEHRRGRLPKPGTVRRCGERSNNLGLDFPTLKTAMVTDGKSLGQAIQAQKSTVDGTTVATRAEHDADTEIRSTEKAPKTPKTKSAGGRP